MKPYLLLPILLLPFATSCASDWGSIRGHIVVEGEIPRAPKRNAVLPAGALVALSESEELLIHANSKGLANVFFYLRKKPELIHPDLVELQQESVELKVQNGRYVPHAILCRTGQEIRARNKDAVPHNAHAFPLKNQPVNLLLKPNAGDEVLLKAEAAERLPVRVTSDFYPWMSANCLVVDHPYAAVTDENGEFRINNLPAGEHSFSVWHERVGFLEKDFKVTVPAGEPIELPQMKIEITRLQTLSKPK